MRNIRTRVRSGGAALLALGSVIVLASCAGGTGDAGDGEVTSITVQDYFTADPDGAVYEAVYDACGEEAGVEVERSAVSGADLISKVLQQASSKTLPDILVLDNPDVQEIASSGALAPLSQFGLSADGLAEGVVDASTYDGEVYGLQPAANSITLFYNPDLLDAAGVSVPTTWDELKAAAAALTTEDQYGIAFSAPANYEGTWQFLPFMWTAGGDESDIDTPETAEALQLWVDMVSAGSASTSVVTWTQPDVNDQFIAGAAAMMINGPWQIPILEEAGASYEIASIPVPSLGDPVIAPLGGESFTLPNTGDAARQAKAAVVLECINSDDSQLTIAQERNLVPTRLSLQDQFVADNPVMAAFSDMVATARARTGELGVDWPEAATKIYTAVQSALVGGLTPSEALEQAQNG